MFIRKYFKMGDFGINIYNNLISVVDKDSVGGGSATALCKLLMKRFTGEYIVYVDYDPNQEAEPTIPGPGDTPTPKQQEITVKKQIWDNLMNYTFEVTYERYKELISYYTTSKTHLLDKIGSRSAVQYNDTPQTTGTGLDADTYATTYTKTTNEVDVELIDRLNKVEKLYSDVMGNWCKEFDKLFIGD